MRSIAEAINQPGGIDAVNLRVAEQYVREFGALARTNNTLILPSNLGDIGSLVGTIMKTVESIRTDTEGQG